MSSADMAVCSSAGLRQARTAKQAEARRAKEKERREDPARRALTNLRERFKKLGQTARA